MTDRIHLANEKLYSGTWCGDASLSYAAIRTDIVQLCTCIPCLSAKADHHREQAVQVTARIVEVIA